MDTSATGVDLQPADQPILFGIVSPTRGVIKAGPTEVTVNPGLTWITAPPNPGSVLEVSATGLDSRPHLVAARLAPDAAAETTTTEHVARHVVSVDVAAHDGAIGGTLITMNPTGTGGNVGMAYAEIPRNGAPPSHGYWQSAAHITWPAQRIDFRYDPTTRTLTETVDGQPQPPMTARDASPVGDYRLRLLLSRGLVDDLSILLMDYRMQDGEVGAAQPFRQTYVFDMPVRPLPGQQ